MQQTFTSLVDLSLVFIANLWKRLCHFQPSSNHKVKRYVLLAFCNQLIAVANLNTRSYLPTKRELRKKAFSIQLLSKVCFVSSGAMSLQFMFDSKWTAAFAFSASQPIFSATQNRLKTVCSNDCYPHEVCKYT